MDIRLNSTKVLIEDILEAEKVTDSGIFLPTAVIKTKTLRGRIIAKGDGTQHVKIPHDIGAVALFNPSAGVKLTYKEKEYRVIDVSEILLSEV